VKLLAGLLTLFLGLISSTQCVIGQVNFPARGFAPLVDSESAVIKVNPFEDAYFGNPKEASYHRAYLYRFQFIHYPRNKSAEVKNGLLSGPYPESPNSRLDILDSSIDQESRISYLLIRDLKDSKVWHWQSQFKEVSQIKAENWQNSWVRGIHHSPFDLLMPFVNWPFDYQKSGRVCGRRSHLFNFTSPSRQKTHKTKLQSIRLALDDTYDAPLRVEHFDGGILPSRIVSLQSLKKVDDRWIVKSVDVKERDSKSRTRFEIQAVAHDLDLSPAIFTSDGLSLPINQSSISFDPI